jgi:hypothetical protein
MDDLIKKLTIIKRLHFSCSHELIMQIHKAIEEDKAKIVTIDLDKMYYVNEEDPEKVIIRRKELWSTYDGNRFVGCKMCNGELFITVLVLEPSYSRNSNQIFRVDVSFLDPSSIRMFEANINLEFQYYLEAEWKQAEFERKQNWIEKRKTELLKN